MDRDASVSPTRRQRNRSGSYSADPLAQPGQWEIGQQGGVGAAAGLLAESDQLSATGLRLFRLQRRQPSAGRPSAAKRLEEASRGQ
jgi:hypothetical protein